MRGVLLTALLCLSAIGWTAGTASGDTSAPNRQTFTVNCGGATITFVSAVEPARAAQIVGITGVGVLQRVVFGGSILFEQPSFRALDPSALTTCTFPVPGGELTFVVLVTPQAGRRP
jgi:hypothetical protein